jgi:hypothetical protein
MGCCRRLGADITRHGQLLEQQTEQRHAHPEEAVSATDWMGTAHGPIILPHRDPSPSSLDAMKGDCAATSGPPAPGTSRCNSGRGSASALTSCPPREAVPQQDRREACAQCAVRGHCCPVRPIRQGVEHAPVRILRPCKHRTMSVAVARCTSVNLSSHISSGAHDGTRVTDKERARPTLLSGGTKRCSCTARRTQTCIAVRGILTPVVYYRSASCTGYSQLRSDHQNP